MCVCVCVCVHACECAREHSPSTNMCTYLAEIDVQLVGLIQSIITPDHSAPNVDGEVVTATTASDVSHMIVM